MCTCEIRVLFWHGRHSNVFFVKFLGLVSVEEADSAMVHLHHRRHQPANVTHVHSVCVRHFE